VFGVISLDGLPNNIPSWTAILPKCLRVVRGTELLEVNVAFGVTREASHEVLASDASITHRRKYQRPYLVLGFRHNFNTLAR